MFRIFAIANNYFRRSCRLYRQGGILFILAKLIRRLLLFFRPLLEVDWFTKVEMLLFLGYWPNLKNPRSFNEKIVYRKLYVNVPLAKVLCDKLAARDYVREKTGRADILNDLYWVGTDANDIPFDSLPNKYVIKVTHGSGWNIFVKDKTAIKREEIRVNVTTWLKSKYSLSSTMISEKHYDDIPPKIIIEKFIDDLKWGFPLDYKFFCFYGKAYYIQVDVDRFGAHKRILFNINWQEMPFSYAYPKSKERIDKPFKFEEMKLIAEQIAQGLEFCRVDLYNPDEKGIFFGEITLYPESGLGRFIPREWDFRLGKLL